MIIKYVKGSVDLKESEFTLLIKIYNLIISNEYIFTFSKSKAGDRYDQIVKLIKLEIITGCVNECSLYISGINTFTDDLGNVYNSRYLIDRSVKFRENLNFDLNDYYVYVCTLDEKPVYVGKGIGSRINHCLSGYSSNNSLNSMIKNGLSDRMKVFKVKESMSNEEALAAERTLINYLKLANFDLVNVR